MSDTCQVGTGYQQDKTDRILALWNSARADELTPDCSSFTIALKADFVLSNKYAQTWPARYG